MTSPAPPPGTPTSAIGLPDAGAATPHLTATSVDVDDTLVERLRATGATVDIDPASRAEASRDWWPLAMVWATDNEIPARAEVVVRPGEEAQVAAIAALCHEARVPLTAAGGRSGVCGASIPVHGGVVLDLCGLSGIRDVDDTSLVVDAAAGTFGDLFEDVLRTEHGLTVGHWPQSMALSTVGGWAACRGAGQYSTRYGKIEDIVTGLDVVLADGRTLSTGGQPRQAVGPDLTQLFLGSEGTLGLITGVRMRAHPVPLHDRRAAYGFGSFAGALDAMRRILRRGARPAVLRLYDAVESARNHQTTDTHVLLVLDEGDPTLVDAGMTVIAQECAAAEVLDEAMVEHWVGHRNDVSALEALISKGYVVDTMEVSGPWARLPAIYEAGVAAIAAVEGTLAASAHQSHSYLDGGCLYFTFAAQVDADQRESYYRHAWDAGTRAVLAHGGALSHHHGVGLNRSRFMVDALGATGLDVLAATKGALDPHGILNPGKLGLPSPFGDVGWP